MRCDASLHDAAVVGLACPDDQATLFHAVKKARHVRVVRNHAVPDAPARQAFGLGAAENAKNIVLCAGKPGGLHELFRLLGQGVGGLQESDEDAVLQGDGRPGGSGVRMHAPEDSCYNEYCQEEKIDAGDLRVRVSAGAEDESH